MIRDRNIEWARQRMYVPLENFQGWTDAHVGLGAGAPAQAEASSFAYYGMVVGAADDAITHVMEFPSMWDITKEIGVRVRWMVNAAVALDDAVVFQILYDQIDNGEVSIEPATALGTVITTQSPAVTTTLAMYRSPRGIIAANTFDEAGLDGMLVFKIVTPTLTQFEATDVLILGVSFDYYPRLTVGGYVALETDRQ